MLLEELARELVDLTSALVGGRTVNIMNTEGVIVASTEQNRVGTFHQGAMDAVQSGKPVYIEKEQLTQYPGAKEGCNMPLRVNGEIIGVVGVYGDPTQVQEVAHLLEVYATKCYQLESVLQPRLADQSLRSQLLMSLLAPHNAAMSAAGGLAERLGVEFFFPVDTVVIAGPDPALSDQQIQMLIIQLEKLGYLRRQRDVWGIVDNCMVLLCGQMKGRDVYQMKKLADYGFRVSRGTPSTNLWQIQDAYVQAALLNRTGTGSFRDIELIPVRCQYLLDRAASQEIPFLMRLEEKLQQALGQENGAIALDSARAYYACGRSVTLAAQQQFIHKNTLQYRVKRVLEVLELTKESPFEQELVIRLLIAYWQRKSRSEDFGKL